MRRIGSRTFDVVLVVAVLALPVLAVITAIEGHPGFLIVMGVTLAMQGWRAKLGGRTYPRRCCGGYPARRRATSSSEGEQQ